MCHSLLRHRMQKNILNMYGKDIEQTCFNKLTKLISSMDKKLLKMFFDASNSSDIEEEIMKQISTLKLFDREPREAIPKKSFVSEEENTVRK